MSQILLPTADLLKLFGTADNWSLPAWSAVAKLVVNDMTFTNKPAQLGVASGYTDNQFLALAPAVTPVGVTPLNTIIHIRLKRLSASSSGNDFTQVYVRDRTSGELNNVMIVQDDAIPIDGNFHQYDVPIDLTNFFGGVHWTNLSLILSDDCQGGGTTANIQCSLLQLEVPDPAPPTVAVITQLPIEIVYPFAFVADQEATTDTWAPATADGTAGSAVSGTPVTTPNANVGGCLPLQDFIDALAAKLEDPTFVHWTAVELKRYIIEALRTYNALSQSLRNRGAFLSTANAPFYDLPTVLPSLRGYNVTDLDLILDLEYALMEPPALGTWGGSLQFTLADLVAAIERRRDLFLRETGAVLTREVRAVTPPSSGRIPFPDDVITIRRVAWIAADSSVTPLRRDDEWGMNQYLPTWPQQSVDPAATWPTAFSIGVTPPLYLQVAPPITDAGSLDLLSVILGDDLGSSAPGVLLGVPDDWTWVIKFGALSDLLSQQGVAFDPARAAYAEARWRQGIALATAATVVLAAKINGVVTPISSVSEADTYDPSWQTTPAPPTRVLTDAQNLVGLSPVPDAGASSAGYTVTLDLVVNFPVPLNTTDCVDVDKSVMEIVIDYAQHLALFKEGPGLVQQSMALYDKFQRACGVTVELDTASVPNRPALFQQTVQDPRILSRRSPGEPSEPSE